MVLKILVSSCQESTSVQRLGTVLTSKCRHVHFRPGLVHTGSTWCDRLQIHFLHLSFSVWARVWQDSARVSSSSVVSPLRPHRRITRISRSLWVGWLDWRLPLTWSSSHTTGMNVSCQDTPFSCSSAEICGIWPSNALHPLLWIPSKNVTLTKIMMKHFSRRN